MSNNFELKNISFSYATSAKPLFENISLSLNSGWTGIIGENGSGKSTLIQLISGILQPDLGKIETNVSASYCPQRTDNQPEKFLEFSYAFDAVSYRLKDMLGIQDDWIDRWNTLSHGERKRLQVAIALWKEPQLLAMDEPTNHLDRYARDLILKSLKSYKDIGIIVSHDREFIDELCTNCLFIDHPAVKIYSGNYTKCAEQRKIEKNTAFSQLQNARKELETLRREIQKRREYTEQAKKHRSKKNIDRKDHDAKAKIDGYIVSGKDAKAGQLKSQLNGRIKQALDKTQSIKINKEYDTEIFLNSELSVSNVLFRIPAGVLNLGEEKLSFPELEIYADDKIALTGLNGTGKSTLIRKILVNTKIDKEKILYIPQEISSDESIPIFNSLKNINNELKSVIMMRIRRLGSDPKRLLATQLPSPGEIRKLIIAFGIQKNPSLIVMDEPTNHLDICSIECLEDALYESKCAFLLVSHDYKFLKKLTNKRWHNERNIEGIVLKKTFW